MARDGIFKTLIDAATFAYDPVPSLRLMSPFAVVYLFVADHTFLKKNLDQWLSARMISATTTSATRRLCRGGRAGGRALRPKLGAAAGHKSSDFSGMMGPDAEELVLQMSGGETGVEVEMKGLRAKTDPRIKRVIARMNGRNKRAGGTRSQEGDRG